MLGAIIRIKLSSFPSLLSKTIYVNTAKLACKGNNTELDEQFNICICKAGFPFGNPENGGDCFRCDPKCHEKAICTSMDKCTCKPGLVGDGIKDCDYPRPTIVSVKPHKCENTDSFLTVVYKSQQVNTTMPYCKIGPSIYPPSEFNGSHAICSCPPLFKGNYSLEISFNKLHWSKQKFTINFPTDDSPAPEVFVYIILCVIISVLIYFIIWCIQKTSWSNGDDGDQILPLNKWHMNQIQHDSNDDGSIFKFIFNLIIG
ncbi:hypothetical protein TVAG_547270 [Trichomonas vaginalis G3]|uniref:EGF-like domain-containing protein n=1 Tax=Trichomonas vaginalis (strain ATCC PRA-98 / G3) TaxID=412133 RepID=A2GCZ9_TRIV3|nr:hypothetical protein TVAGG3_0494870 [Trichomonas vaginalis G3]EAX84968.1 hypothetical protein TVAG_547270 [Trichomonas vaginalis G3]KAI5516639.1 hypothetical protein TVAGG3_0494870 [Trichomonas vaginalis G3]|eukprot:XP_001297898.1 hypothetical protein [Trichomonas vaginalis G3]